MLARDTVRKHISNFANQVIESKQYKIFEYELVEDSRFYCKCCGSSGNLCSTLFVYVITTGYGYTWHDMICRDCHENVHAKIYYRTIGKQVRIYKKQLEQAKSQLRKVKRMSQNVPA